MIIYVITNTSDGKKYVGQTVKSLEHRWQGHLAHARWGRRDMALLVAIREHGESAFTMEVVQTCSSQEELNVAERAWIERLDTVIPNGYNAGFGIWRHPRQSARISASMRGRKITWGRKISANHGQRGRPLTEAQIAALAAGRELGRTRVVRSASNSHRKLTDDAVREIRRLVAAGELSQREIGERFGVQQSAVSKIARRVTLAHVPDAKPQED